MSKYTDQYNIVLGSQPQLPVAVLGPNEKFDSRRIPHNVADGTMRVEDGRVSVGRGAASARATMDVGGGLVVEGNVRVINGTIFGQVGETEISVKDCGAVADGITDDTAAFQACLDNAAMPTVLVPPGTYAIRGTLFVRRPVRLVGFAGSVLQKSAARQNPLIVVQTISGGVVRDVEMLGLTFSSARIPNGNAPFFSDNLDFLHQDNKQACIALMHADGALVSGCTFSGFARGVVTANGRATVSSGLSARAVTIERCVFDEYNVGLLTSHAHDVRVAQCTFRGQRILEGEDAGEAHAWFSADDCSGLVLDDVYLDDLRGAAPAVHWRNVDGGLISTVRVRAIDALARLHECRHVRLHSVVGDLGGHIGGVFIAVTSDTALRTTANPNRYDVEISDVHVRLTARALHVDHADVVCVRDCVFSYVDEMYDAIITTAAHYRQDHSAVLRNLTIRFKNFVPTMPVASLRNATLETLNIIADLDAYSQEMDIPTYVAAVGSFQFSGTVQLWIEQGLTRRAPTTTVWSTSEATNDVPSAETTAYLALTLEPSVPRGLTSALSSAHGATVIPRHDDSTVRIQLKSGQSASSLFTTANKAPIIDGVPDSHSNRASEYSHALNAPPVPGAFRLRVSFYVDAAFAASIPFDQSTPFMFLPWSIPGYGTDAIFQSHVYINSERDVIMYYRTGWYDPSANTKRAADGQWEISTNVWHEMTLTYERTTANTYHVVYAIDDQILIDRMAIASLPFVDAVHVGSHGWKQGVWVGEIAHETLETVQKSKFHLYEENGQGMLVIRDGVVDIRGNLRMGGENGPSFTQGGWTANALAHAIPLAVGSGTLFVHVRAPGGVLALFQLSYLKATAAADADVAVVSIFKSSQDVSFEVEGTSAGIAVHHATPFAIAWTVVGA